MSPENKNHISKVAIVGATGSLGSSVLTALLSETDFTITIVTRPGSVTAESHPSLTSNPRINLVSGSYTDHNFLTSALQGQDAVIITLGFAICPVVQPGIIRAACEVKVPYILPCEFGSDTDNPALIAAIPVQQAKVDARRLVEELGVDGSGKRTSFWIGIANNAWYDWSLPGGFFGVDVKTRKATIFDDGNVKAYLSTIKLSGLATARVLSLPLTASTAGLRTLPSYANKFVYVRSFAASQRDILSSVQRATKTTDSDWEFSYVSVQEHILQGVKEIEKGNMAGIMNIIYGNVFVPGIATDYRDAQLDNETLALEGIEDFNEVTAAVIEEIDASSKK